MDAVEEKQDAITFPYERDGITLHCGDNCETMLRMPAESVDLVVTSPPYDDLRTYGGHSWDFYGVAWNLKRLLKPGGVIVWVVNDSTKDGDETGSSFRQAMFFKDVGLRLHDTMIYHRQGAFPMDAAGRYWQDSEYMFVFAKGKPKTFNPIKEVSVRQAGSKINRRKLVEKCDGTPRETGVASGTKSLSNVWRYVVGSSMSEDSVAFQHPATFPEALARDHILSWSNEGDTVLDPFSGSGTTLKMARETGRRGIGIEINEEYCQISVTRLRQRLLFGMEESAG